MTSLLKNYQLLRLGQMGRCTAETCDNLPVRYAGGNATGTGATGGAGGAGGAGGNSTGGAAWHLERREL